MKRKIISCFFIVFLAGITALRAKAQETSILNLKEGSRNNPFSLSQMYIDRENLNTSFIDSSRYRVLRTGVIRYAPYQYLWQQYKAGKYSADTINTLIIKRGIDTAQLSDKPLKNAIYAILLLQKNNADTILALSGDLIPGLQNWQLISFSKIMKGSQHVNNSNNPGLFNFIGMQLLREKTIIQTNGYLFFSIDTAEASLGKRLLFADSYYRFCTATVNNKQYKIFIGADADKHYFNAVSTRIRIEAADGKKDSTTNQTYRIGDIIQLNNSNIRLANVSPNGSTIELTDISSAKITIDGFNSGDKFEGFIYKDIVGNYTSSTKNILEKKKILLLSFWGTWCAPCIDAIPGLARIFEKYKSDIDIISIASEKKMDTANLLNAIQKYNMPWRHMMVNNQESHLKTSILYYYRIEAYPTFILANQDNIILMRTISHDFTWLEKILKEKLGY